MEKDCENCYHKQVCPDAEGNVKVYDDEYLNSPEFKQRMVEVIDMVRKFLNTLKDDGVDAFEATFALAIMTGEMMEIGDRVHPEMGLVEFMMKAVSDSYNLNRMHKGQTPEGMENMLEIIGLLKRLGIID